MASSPAGSSSGACSSLILRDFTYRDAGGAEVADVLGAEVLALFRDLATHNGWKLEDLLTNCSIPRGSKLACRVVQSLPSSCKFWDGHADYVVTKLSHSRVVAGRSFAREGSGDTEWVARAARSKRQATEPTLSSPPRRKLRKAPPPAWHSDFSTDNPVSPEQSKGSVYPLPIYLHRVAYLSACANRSERAPELVRHVCGNSRCAVIAHYRPGPVKENDSDRKYHKNHRGKSRSAMSPLQ